MLEQTHIGPERCEMFEQQREIVAVAQHLGGKVFDRAVSIQEPCCRDRTDADDTGIAVGAVPDKGEEIRDQHRIDSEFFAHASRVTDFLTSAINLHYPV